MLTGPPIRMFSSWSIYSHHGTSKGWQGAEGQWLPKMLREEQHPGDSCHGFDFNEQSPRRSLYLQACRGKGSTELGKLCFVYFFFFSPLQALITHQQHSSHSHLKVRPKKKKKTLTKKIQEPKGSSKEIRKAGLSPSRCKALFTLIPYNSEVTSRLCALGIRFHVQKTISQNSSET